VSDAKQEEEKRKLLQLFAKSEEGTVSRHVRRSQGRPVKKKMKKLLLMMWKKLLMKKEILMK
jgi:hypothetical protein